MLKSAWVLIAGSPSEMPALVVPWPFSLESWIMEVAAGASLCAVSCQKILARCLLLRRCVLYAQLELLLLLLLYQISALLLLLLHVQSSALELFLLHALKLHLRLLSNVISFVNLFAHLLHLVFAVLYCKGLILHSSIAGRHMGDGVSLRSFSAHISV